MIGCGDAKVVFDKDKFYLLKYVVDRFDGQNVSFKIIKKMQKFIEEINLSPSFYSQVVIKKEKNKLKFCI